MTTQPLPEPPAAGAPKWPYRGIEEFRYVDAPIFFGRDFEARRLLRLVTIYRGVLLYGDSGVGKSSLVNAKVMPLAVEDGYAPERVRVQPVKGAEFVVERIAPSDEGEDYLPSLFDDGKRTRRVSVPADEFLARLEERCRVGATDAPAYPLIIFDQFEELVTLTEQVGRRDAGEAHEAHDAIVRTLLRILRDDGLRVKLLFVFREDYYAKLTRFFAQSPTLVDNYLRLEPLHSSQLDAIINGPFRAAAFDHELPADVAELLKTELTERGDLLTLSEVQIACLHLWHAPEPMKLLQERHVSGLLETYFSEAIEALPETLRDPATAILDELVTDSGTRNVVSAETLIDALEEGHAIARETSRQALEALDRSAHVIRRERRNDVEVYEIVSEFLVPWIMRRKIEALAKKEYEGRVARLRKVAWRVLGGVAAGVALLVGWLIYKEVTTSQEYLQKELRRVKAERDASKASFGRSDMAWRTRVAMLEGYMRRLAAHGDSLLSQDKLQRDQLPRVAAQLTAEQKLRLTAEQERDQARGAEKEAREETAKVRNEASGHLKQVLEELEKAKADRDKALKAQAAPATSKPAVQPSQSAPTQSRVDPMFSSPVLRITVYDLTTAVNSMTTAIRQKCGFSADLTGVVVYSVQKSSSQMFKPCDVITAIVNGGDQPRAVGSNWVRNLADFIAITAKAKGGDPLSVSIAERKDGFSGTLFVHVPKAPSRSSTHF